VLEFLGKENFCSLV